MNPLLGLLSYYTASKVCGDVNSDGSEYQAERGSRSTQKKSGSFFATSKQILGSFTIVAAGYAIYSTRIGEAIP